MTALSAPPTATARQRAATRRPIESAPFASAALARAAARRLKAARGRDFRREFDAFVEALAQPEASSSLDPSLLVDAEATVAAHFETESVAVLAQEIVWGDEDQAFADWAIRAYERWAGVSMAYARLEIAAFGARTSLAPRLATMAMASLGNAVKWRAIAGRSVHDLQALHETYRAAEAAGIARERAPALLGAHSGDTTAETLYLRALLFEALCAGALSRPEMEIVDGWLLLWCKDFHVVRAPPGDGCPVAVGVHGMGGLEPGGRAQGPATRYISGLAGLPARIGAIREAFHEGRLVAETRHADARNIAHYVSALSRLEELLAYWANPEAQRERRAPARDGASVPFFVGLGEILARGFGPVTEEPATGPEPAAGRVAPAGESGRSSRHTGYGMVLEPLGMRAAIVDRSPRGLGLALSRGDSEAVSIGDLVGIRDGDLLKVGRVVRAYADPSTGRHRVGVSLLATDPARVNLVAIGTDTPKALAEVTGLHLRGPDPAGLFDALLVNRATFETAGTYAMAAGEATHMICFCRDQVSGRGWVAARFAMLDVQPAGDGSSAASSGQAVAARRCEPGATSNSPGSR